MDNTIYPKGTARPNGRSSHIKQVYTNSDYRVCRLTGMVISPFEINKNRQKGCSKTTLSICGMAKKLQAKTDQKGKKIYTVEQSFQIATDTFRPIKTEVNKKPATSFGKSKL